MNKEDKHAYVMPFPSWICRFIPNLHLTPQGLVVKKGKNDRLVFDGSHLINYKSTCVNMLTKLDLEPKILYGTALQRHLNRIWNLRISYPNKDILLWDGDVSGAFRWNKYHPDIASVFAFILFGTLYIPSSQCFGGNTSA